MSELIRRLRIDHGNFVRLLDVLEEELGRVTDEQGQVNYSLMQDIMVYMTHYPDQFHHPKEDLMFSRMAERDRALHTLIDGLAEEHLTLARKGSAFLRILQNVVDGELVRRNAIESLGREYVETLRSHIETEEAQVLGIAETLLQEHDWAEIDSAMEHMEDPLFGPVVENDYHILYEHILQES